MHALFQAADLKPADPMPVSFLGRTCDAVSAELRVQIQARLQKYLSNNSPRSDLKYDLASCLLKSDEISSNADLDGRIEVLLRRVIDADPNYADAYFHLGNLYEGERRYQNAIAQYECAAGLNRTSAAIHYRRGQALSRSGNSTRVKEEFATFQRLQKSETEATNKYAAPASRVPSTEMSMVLLVLAAGTEASGTGGRPKLICIPGPCTRS